MATLTHNAVQFLRTKDYVFPAHDLPRLQVLTVRKVENASGNADRYRLDLSDGTCFTEAMLATQFNEAVKSNKIRPNTIIKVKEHIQNVVATREILIVLDLDIVAMEANKIGNPVEYSAAAANSRPAQQQQQHRPNPQPHPQTTTTATTTTHHHPATAFNSPAGSYASLQQQQQQQQQPPPAAMITPQVSGNRGAFAAIQHGGGGGGGGGQRGPDGTAISPIKNLNPYASGWCIKARVTSKSEVKTWDKGGDNRGKLFSADLMDSFNGEIRATFFKEAVDMFYDQLHPGSVYFFQGGKLKVANRQYSNVQNEYEVTFDSKSHIAPAADAKDIPRIQVNAVPIAKLDEHPSKTKLDVLAVVMSHGEPAQFTSKNGKELKKLEVELIDKSMASVKLTVWGGLADEVYTKLSQAGPNPVMAVKNVEVGDFQGKNLSTSFSGTSVVVSPDLPEAGALKSWYDMGGWQGTAIKQLSGQPGGGGGGGMGGRGPVTIENRMTFEGLQDVGRDGGDAKYAEVKAWIAFIKRENMWYAACPSCNKKVTKNPSNDDWYCEKCSQNYQEPTYRFIASFNLSDSTGSYWVSAFNEHAQLIFGHSAQDMERYQREDEAMFDAIIKEATFKQAIFRLKIKEEFYQDKAKVKYTIMDYRPVEWVAETAELQRAIAMLEMRPDVMM